MERGRCSLESKRLSIKGWDLGGVGSGKGGMKSEGSSVGQSGGTRNVLEVES